MDPKDIARLITEDPDVFNEDWEELGIEDPGLNLNTPKWVEKGYNTTKLVPGILSGIEIFYTDGRRDKIDQPDIFEEAVSQAQKLSIAKDVDKVEFGVIDQDTRRLWAFVVSNGKIDPPLPKSNSEPSWSGKPAQMLWAITIPTGDRLVNRAYITGYRDAFIVLYNRKPNQNDVEETVDVISSIMYPKAEPGEEWKGDPNTVGNQRNRQTAPQANARDEIEQMIKDGKRPRSRGEAVMMSMLPSQLRPDVEIHRCWILNPTLGAVWSDGTDIYFGTRKQFDEIADSATRHDDPISSKGDPGLVQLETGDLAAVGDHDDVAIDDFVNL